MTRPTRDAEVMDLAVDLYAQEMARGEREARDQALAVAAREVGIPETFVQRATELIAARDRETFARVARRKRIAWVVSGAALAAGLALALLLRPPPSPVVDGFEGASARWSLDKNTETHASVRDTDGVLAVRVEAFGAAADGKYHVNLDRTADLAPLDRHHRAMLRVRGRGLQVVRLFLEGDGVRWRSPPVTLSEDWQTHTLDFSVFERQNRGASGFRVVGRGDVSEVRTWSLKVGHFMNALNATGEVEVDELRFE